MNTDSQYPKQVVEMALGQAIALADDGVRALQLILEWDSASRPRKRDREAPRPGASKE